MIRIIDKYISKQFIQTIFFALLVFISIFVVIDLMEKLDDFIDHNVGFLDILNYYIVFIPEIIKLLIPVSILLASLSTAGKMSNTNELAAIKSAGISLYRFMLPFVLITILISFVAIYFGGYVVPNANKDRILFEQTKLNKGNYRNDNNVFFQDSKTRIVTIGYYNTDANSATNISIQNFDKKNINRMVSRIDAEKMDYDTTSHKWCIINGVKRELNGKEINFSRFDSLSINYLNFSPNDVIRKQQKPEEMTLSELKLLASDLRNSGNNPDAVLIEYYSRYAFGFAGLIVVLFGLPLSANKRKGGLALQFGINLAITFIYLVFMKVSQALGKNGTINPALTAWLANIIFFIGALINIIRAEK